MRATFPSASVSPRSGYATGFCNDFLDGLSVRRVYCREPDAALGCSPATLDVLVELPRSGHLFRFGGLRDDVEETRSGP